MMNNTGASSGERFVDQLLLESDIDDDGGLRPALVQLRALARTAPEPSADVAALMAGQPAGAPVTSAGPVDELGARRRLKRRLAFTSLSVAAALTAGGAAAVASDQQLRESLNHFNQAVFSLVTGTGSDRSEDQPEQPALPAQPAVPAGPASVPAAPAPMEAPAATPQPDASKAEGTGPGGATPPAHPGAAPARETLPRVAPRDVAPSLGGAPAVPVPRPSELPLAGTVPTLPVR